MAKKVIRFCVNQLIIDQQSLFKMDDFSSLKEEDVDTFDIGKGEKREILMVKRIKKNVESDRVLTLYFESGEKYPYPAKVIAPDLEEHDNPRPADLIELDKQLFVLIDLKSQRIFISDQRQKTQFCIWLKEKLDKDIIIKSLIDEKRFIEKIKSIDKVAFSITPDLFNTGSEDILSKNLVRDIFSFGAQRAEVQLDYNYTAITDKIKNKLGDLIANKNQFESIVVIGRSDENFESVFNLEEVSNKIIVDVDVNNESTLLDPAKVFSSLIEKLN